MSCHDISHLMAIARKEGVGKPGRHDSVKGFVAVEESVCGGVTDAMAYSNDLGFFHHFSPWPASSLQYSDCLVRSLESVEALEQPLDAMLSQWPMSHLEEELRCC